MSLFLKGTRYLAVTTLTFGAYDIPFWRIFALDFSGMERGCENQSFQLLFFHSPETKRLQALLLDIRSLQYETCNMYWIF